MLHVIPINDVIDHIESKGCPCRPRTNEDNVMVHNAVDGRVDLENAIGKGNRVKLNAISFYSERLFFLEGKELISASRRREMLRDAICRLFDIDTDASTI